MLARNTLIVACLLGALPSVAATIDRHDFTDKNEPAVITVEGELLAGDERTFVDKALGIQDAIVVFRSEGGNLFAGLQIGQAIHLKGFTTLVSDGDTCASACALAWLGGRRRFMAPTAKIGFHAAYELKGGLPIERGAPNAQVGAYLTALGFPPEAVYFVTNSPPEGMSWLNIDLAKQYGIWVEPWNTENQAFETSGPLTSPEPSSEEQRAIYYFQGSEGQNGQASQGTATWAQITKDGRPAIQATLRIPDRNVTATVTIYENHDSTLPASHLVEVQFSGELASSPIQRIPALVMKQTEQARGQPLAGAAVPVSKRLFWIALSDDAGEVVRNVQLLREGSWFDIPILFNDQTRALLTFEKGSGGQTLVAAVLDHWSLSKPPAALELLAPPAPAPAGSEYRVLPNGTMVKVR